LTAVFLGIIYSRGIEFNRITVLQFNYDCNSFGLLDKAIALKKEVD